MAGIYGKKFMKTKSTKIEHCVRPHTRGTRYNVHVHTEDEVLYNKIKKILDEYYEMEETEEEA